MIIVGICIGVDFVVSSDLRGCDVGNSKREIWDMMRMGGGNDGYIRGVIRNRIYIHICMCG